MSKKILNPFTVLTPETLSAEDMNSLFVDVFTDFNQILHPGHTIIRGPRGSGKSMMLRFMQPDCQLLHTGKSLQKLKYFAIYVPIKQTDLNITELLPLASKAAGPFFNEHLLCLRVASRTFKTLADLNLPAKWVPIIRSFINEQLGPLLIRAGLDPSGIKKGTIRTARGLFTNMVDLFDDIYEHALNYVRASFNGEQTVYDGTLLSYFGFLMPLLSGVKKFQFMPNAPIYLLVDDADNLNEVQTKILNTWVSSRSSAVVSLKISSQYGYKTYRTISGPTIDTPHDYTDVNIATVYTTSSSDRYRDRVKKIIQLRLKRAGIAISPEEFFPEDAEQEAEIKRIAIQIKNSWKDSGRGFSANDDAYRYARPDYIKSLHGQSKSAHTYSYAGFSQLVALSSGIVRYFLESAERMFDEARAMKSRPASTPIPPGIQDKVVGETANRILDDFEKLQNDETNISAKQNLLKLKNLTFALGGAFHAILLSDRSERRVFSFAISDDIDEDSKEVIYLGIRLGYFHESSIGNKEGTGRKRLYVLNRRLAPFFKLDPTSFAGYKFWRAAAIREAMHSPNSLIRTIKNSKADEQQESLFEIKE